MQWMNVVTIAVEYNDVNDLFRQGKPVAISDYYNAKAIRQILSAERGSVEVGLISAGVDLF